MRRQAFDTGNGRSDGAELARRFVVEFDDGNDFNEVVDVER